MFCDVHFVFGCASVVLCVISTSVSPSLRQKYLGQYFLEPTLKNDLHKSSFRIRIRYTINKVCFKKYKKARRRCAICVTTGKRSATCGDKIGECLVLACIFATPVSKNHDKTILY